MPFYDYYCSDNGKTVEVYHGIHERLQTWGEVCARVQMDPDPTAADSKVLRLVIGVQPVVFRLKGLDKDAPSGKLDLS